MQGYMKAEALELTISSGQAHYFSRSRKVLLHKGATSGLTQQVHEVMIDDDQDCIWLKVVVTGGASCHAAYRSCFYRRVRIGEPARGIVALELTDTEKVFEPEEAYGDAPDPTVL